MHRNREIKRYSDGPGILSHIWTWCRCASVWALIAVAASAQDTHDRRLSEEQLPVITTASDESPLTSGTQRDPTELRRSSDEDLATMGPLEHAVYTAKLDEDGSLVGRAVLHCRRAADAPWVAQLGALNLAVSNPEWADNPGQTALLGVGPSGQPTVVIQNGRRLTFDWSAQPIPRVGSPSNSRVTEKGSEPLMEINQESADVSVRRVPPPVQLPSQRQYQLQLPHCLSSRLELTTPAGVVVQTDHGIVSRSVVGSDQTGPPKKGVLWTIELGSDTFVSVTVTMPNAQTAVRYGKQSTFELSRRGLELGVDLSLEISPAPVGHVFLQLDPQLNLTTASIGDREIPWQVASKTDDGALIVLNLESHAQRTDPIITLKAFAPIQLGRAWRLPGIRPISLLWRQGSAVIRLQRGLEIQQLRIDNGRQTRIEPLPARRGGESIEIQHFGPFGGSEVVLTPRRPILTASLQSVVSMSDYETRHTMLCDLGAAYGKCFRAEFALANDWEITSVEAPSASGAVDWQVVDGSLESRVLSVEFENGVDVGDEVRLVIRGNRAAYTLDTEFTIDEILFGKLRASEIKSHVAAIGTEGAVGLEISHDLHLTKRSLDHLDIDYWGFDAADSVFWNLIFEADDSTQPLRFRRVRSTPRYSAEVEVQASVQDSELHESYLIRCQPEDLPVTRLIVRFSQHRTSVPTWFAVQGSKVITCNARRVSPANSGSTGPIASGETWMLDFGEPFASSFEVRAQRRMKLREEQSVSLAMLPDAISQSGRVTVSTNPASNVVVENVSRLEPLVPDASSVVSGSQAVSAFQYRNDGRDDTNGLIALGKRAADDDETQAWVWRSHADFTVSRDGNIVQQVSFNLHKSGLERISMRLPHPAVLQSLMVNGESRKSKVGPNRAIAVPLPPAADSASIVVRATISRTRLKLLDELNLPVPDLELPVLHQRYTIRLPSDFSLSGSNAPINSPKVFPTLMERFLGVISINIPIEHRLDSVDITTLGNGPRVIDARNWLRSLGESARDEFETNLTAVLGDVLKGAVASQAAGLQMAVDWRAMAARGVAPDTEIEELVGSTDEELGTELLSALGLVVVVGGDRILLTTVQSLRQGQASWKPTTHSCIVTSNQQLTALTDDHFLAAAWSSQSDTQVLLWPDQEDDDYRLGVAGKNIIHIQRAADNLTTVSIHNATIFRCIGWTVFLASFAIVSKTRRRRFLVVLLTFAVSGVACLWLPLPWLPLSYGLFRGVCLGVALTVFFPRPVHAPSAQDPEDAKRLQLATVVGFIVLLLSFAVPAWAAEDGASTVAADEDEQGQHRALTANGSEPAVQAGGSLARDEPISVQRSVDWLISGAHYSGSLGRDAARADWVIPELLAEFDVFSIDREVDISFPFDARDVTVPLNRCEVNGGPAVVAWSDDSTSLRVRLENAGISRVTLPLLPLDGTSADGLRIHIPTVPNAHLVLKLPMGHPQVMVGAIGKVEVDGNRELHADLGPTDQITVRSRDRAAPVDPTADLEVSEYLWLKVRPGEVVLDALFRVDRANLNPSRIELIVDPNLRWVPLIDQRIITDFRIRREPLPRGDSQIIELQLAETFNPFVEFKTRFFVANTSGIGVVQLPRLAVSGGEFTSRLLAVTIDPTLTHEARFIKPIRELSSDEFVKIWGPRDDEPDRVFHLPSGQFQWNLATRPREAEATATSQLELLAHADHARLRWTSELHIMEGQIFQLRLRVPSELEIQSLSMIAVQLGEAAEELVSHWSADTDGGVHIFFSRPIIGHARLIIDGRMSVNSLNQAPLARFEMQDVVVSDSSVRIYRGPDALVQISSGQSPSDAKNTPLSQAPRDGYRQVGNYSNTDNIKCHVTANDLTASCQLTMHLHQSDGAWWTRINCQFNVERGSLDFVRFSVPESWGDRLECPSSVHVQWKTGPRAHRRILMLWPTEPSRGQSELTFQATIPGFLGDRTDIPVVYPLDLDVTRHIVVLPGQINGRSVRWTTKGMEPAKLPELINGNPKSVVALAVTDRDFQARYSFESLTMSPLRVPFADVRLTVGLGTDSHGLATFYLEPHGAVDCLCEFPVGFKMMRAFAGGAPIQSRRIDDRRWRVGLRGTLLPQRLEIVYSGRLDVTPGKSRELPAPRIVDAPASESLWTIGLPDRQWQIMLQGAEAIGETEHAIDSYMNTSRLILESKPFLKYTDSDDAHNWFHSWREPLRFQQNHVDRCMLNRTTAIDPNQIKQRAEMELIRRRLEEFEALLVRDRSEIEPARASVAKSPSTIWTVLCDQDVQYFRGRARDMPTMTLLRPRGRPSWLTRCLASVGLVVSAVAAGFIFARIRLDVLHWRLAPAIGILLGLLWWRFLSPDIVGWVIVGLCLILALRPNPTIQPAHRI